MKKLFALLLAITPLVATAQYNPDIIYTDISKAALRTEIILPEVNGYTLYKADLHIHTIYSDGDCTPTYRVREAWNDGLDIIAITDHIEYRRQEPRWLEFLKGYTGGEAIKARNRNVIKTPATEEGILVDLNYGVKEAVKAAEKYDMLVIPAAEITREPVNIGHYNVLFTTDNNKIYDPDPLQSMRNARKQGALIMHNHPGWKRKSVAKTEFELQAYSEGLIDGIEVVNGVQFYPKIIDRAVTENLFMASNTDIHPTTAEHYRMKGDFRNMTFILAKDKSLKSIREALEARRTICYSGGQVIGEESLLKALFDSSIKAQVISTDKKNQTIAVTNMSSLNYKLRRGRGITHDLTPFQTIIFTIEKGKPLTAKVMNMWCGEKNHPNVEIKAKK